MTRRCWKREGKVAPMNSRRSAEPDAPGFEVLPEDRIFWQGGF